MFQRASTIWKQVQVIVGKVIRTVEGENNLFPFSFFQSNWLGWGDNPRLCIDWQGSITKGLLQLSMGVSMCLDMVSIKTLNLSWRGLNRDSRSQHLKKLVLMLWKWHLNISRLVWTAVSIFVEISIKTLYCNIWKSLARHVEKVSTLWIRTSRSRSWLVTTVETPKLTFILTNDWPCGLLALLHSRLQNDFET